MKKLRNIVDKNGIFLASLIFAVTICLPQLLTGNRPVSAEEQILIGYSRSLLTITSLRCIVLILIIHNITLVYAILSSWMSKRRAGLSIFMLASIPVWLLAQITIPRLTLCLTPLLLGLWAFDKAGRTQKATRWYALSGVALTLAWILQPIATSIIMATSLFVLAISKPRYIKHIIRQGSLVLIILGTSVGVIAAAAWRFNFGLQAYIVTQIHNATIIIKLPGVIWTGPGNYHVGLPGISIIPIAILALSGLGAWQLLIARKRPRNLFMLLYPASLILLGLQFTGLTSVLLLSVAMTCIAFWAVMGAQYLHNSWKRVFPHNKLAKNVGDGLIALMLASLVLYSFWYINRAWAGNPAAQNQAKIEWNGWL